MRENIENLYADLKKSLTEGIADVNQTSSFLEIGRATKQELNINLTEEQADFIKNLPLCSAVKNFVVSYYYRSGYGLEVILEDKNQKGFVFIKAHFDFENPLLEASILLEDGTIPVDGEVLIPIGRTNCGTLVIKYVSELPEDILSRERLKF